MSRTDRITSYIPFSRLWHGPEGEVWRAVPSADPDGGKNVILKVALDPQGQHVLAAEADCTSRLVGGGEADGADNVVRISDAATGFDPPYLVYTDYGNTLAAHVAKRGALDESATANLLRDILAALAFAESRGVAHGALTPASVIVDHGLNAMVADFRGDEVDPALREPRAPSEPVTAAGPNGSNGSNGASGSGSASASSSGDAGSLAPAWSLMYAGDVDRFCEPDAFVAPEARLGVPMARSDLYSAGMIAAYALLGESPTRRFDRQMERKEISQTMRRIILKLTDPNPIRRYDDAAAAMKVVETIYLARSRDARFDRITSDPQANVKEGIDFSKYKPLIWAALVPIALVFLGIGVIVMRKQFNDATVRGINAPVPAVAPANNRAGRGTNPGDNRGG